MAVRAVSVEIGYLFTKVCEVDYKAKAHKVHNSFTFPTPEGVVNDGAIEITDELVEAFKEAFLQNKVKSKQLIFSITSSKIASRDVSIPFVKENRVADVVKANAPDYFPVDLEQYQVAYSILGTEGDEKTGKKYRLNVLAAPKKIIDGYYALASKLKMEVLEIDYYANSLFQIAKDACKEGTSMIVKIEGHSTLVMAIKNGAIDFSRSLPYGLDEALSYIKESSEWGVAVNDIAALDLANRDYTTQSEEIKKRLDMLIGAVGRLFEFYISRGQDVVIDHVYLTGMGGDFKGLDRLIGEHLEREVTVLTDHPEILLKSHITGNCPNMFAATVGASIAPVGLRRDDEKKAKSAKTGTAVSSNSSVDPVLIGVIVCILGVLVAIGMIAFAAIRYTGLKAANIALNTQKDDLMSVVDVYTEFMATQAEYDAMMGIEKATTSFNDELVAFFEELERRLPSDVAVSSFAADASNVTMTMKVSSKSEAAKAIEELREFDTLIPGSVTVSALSMEMDEATKMPISVSFTVSAMYNPKPVDEEEMLDGGADIAVDASEE